MKLGFIGCGNMAQAMMGGMIKSNLINPQDIIASDAHQLALDNAKKNLNIQITTDNKTVAKECDMIVLSVKPQFYETVIDEIRTIVKDEVIIITIAPGKTLETIEKLFDRKIKIIRTMPNTPAMVNEGMTAMCLNSQVTKEEGEEVKKLLNGFGKAEIVQEYLMDSVVAVSGSSPAYVFMMIEAMADAAVLKGMPRNQAYKFAAQAVLGSAKMVLELDKHPGDLKDMVCSPAGTTIEAVRVLEERNFRSSIIEAMKACAEKSNKM